MTISGDQASPVLATRGMFMTERCSMTRVHIRILLVAALVVSVLPISLVSPGSASAQAFGTQAFERTWARTDLPVANGQANRTWMWGPSGHTAAFQEPYFDAPGGTRLVQYTDKSRMEDNSYRAGAPWDVTNGRLAYELITGNRQHGDADYQQFQPSSSQVAGDSHPNSPTYATFNGVLNHDPFPNSWTITETIDQAGGVGSNGSLGQYGVTAEHHVLETNHTVASVFWQFMNSSGTVYQAGQYQYDQLFENPYFATGFPITEAYWMNVPVGGQWRDVLAQCFERRCLTYNPANPAGWQVEAGNIGQHYHAWRYGDSMQPPPSGPDQGEVQYVEDLVYLLEVTVISFEVFDWLLENPSLNNAWYSDFDDVMEVWLLLHPALNSLTPPPDYVAFHNKLLDAYWVLGAAAEDLIYAFYQLDEYWLEQGFNKLNTFIDLLEEAFELFPEQPDNIVYLGNEDSDIAPELDRSILDPERREGLFD